MFRLERDSRQRQVLIYAALPLAYVISGRLGLLLAVPPGYATAVFLPAGIAVAAMFIAGAATLPGTFVGSFLLNIWAGYSIAHQLDSASVATALVIACVSTLQAAIGGTVLRRIVGYPASLDTLSDLAFFLVLSPVFCLTSATLSLGGMWALHVVQAPDLPINWMTWWVGDTLGVVFALPLMLALAGEPRALWRLRARYVAAPMILCFALFVAIFVRVSRWENDASLLEFRLQSQRFAEAMKTNLEEQALLLDQLSSVFGSRRLVLNRQDFHGLVQKLLNQYPTIQAVEWAPHIAAVAREAFEAAQSTDFPDFVIRERNSSGQLEPAGGRSEFYPVTYLEPLRGNEQAVGFDLASNPDRRMAIEATINNGRVVATAPIRLVQERERQAGILLVNAVSEGPTGPGIMLVVLRMGTFVRVLTEPLAAVLTARFIDAAGTSPFFDGFAASAHATYETAFEFGTRRYIVETAPTALYLAQHRGWQSWAVLAAGVLGTGLLGALLMLGTGYTFRIERLAALLRENESRLSAVVQQIPFGVGLMDHDGRWILTNSAMRRFVPTTIPSRDPERIDRWRTFTADGHSLKVDQWPSARALRGETVSPGTDFIYTDDDGRELSIRVAAAPFLKPDGTVAGAVAVVQDLTELKHGEQTRQQLATIVELSRDAIWSWAIDGTITAWNGEAERMLGYTAKEILGKSLLTLVPPERIAAARDVIAKVRHGEGWGPLETVRLRKNGTPLHVELTVSPIRDSKGRVTGAATVCRDITLRKRAEETERILIREINHRSNNLLAIIQSIAQRTLSGDCSLAEARQAFEARLQALSRINRQLTESDWSGLNVKEVVRQELEPFADRTVTEGIDITLSSQHAQNFSMVLHELVTNAVKHGALSTGTGKIGVFWTVASDNENRILKFRWQERGGPPVIAPTRRGFGTVLFNTAFGGVRLDYAAEGLSCEFEVPLGSQN